jgi:hypothetical protein
MANVQQQGFTRRSRLQAFAHPFYQAQLEPRFKLPDLQADRRLGQPQALGGGTEAAQADYVGKGVQVREVQVLHGKVLLMLGIADHSFFYAKPACIMGLLPLPENDR